MNWEEYHNIPELVQEGYWTDVSYRPTLLQGNDPVRGFFAVEGHRITTIGHASFSEQQPPKTHHYLFDASGAIYSEHRPRIVRVRGVCEEIDPDLNDQFVDLAMDFRAIFPQYQKSLDSCIRNLSKLTGKR